MNLDAYPRLKQGLEDTQTPERELLRLFNPEGMVNENELMELIDDPEPVRKRIYDKYRELVRAEYTNQASRGEARKFLKEALALTQEVVHHQVNALIMVMLEGWFLLKQKRSPELTKIDKTAFIEKLFEEQKRLGLSLNVLQYGDPLLEILDRHNEIIDFLSIFGFDKNKPEDHQRLVNYILACTRQSLGQRFAGSPSNFVRVNFKSPLVALRVVAENPADFNLFPGVTDQSNGFAYTSYIPMDIYGKRYRLPVIVTRSSSLDIADHEAAHVLVRTNSRPDSREFINENLKPDVSELYTVEKVFKEPAVSPTQNEWRGELATKVGSTMNGFIDEVQATLSSAGRDKLDISSLYVHYDHKNEVNAEFLHQWRARIKEQGLSHLEHAQLLDDFHIAQSRIRDDLSNFIFLCREFQKFFDAEGLDAITDTSVFVAMLARTVVHPELRRLLRYYKRYSEKVTVAATE